MPTTFLWHIVGAGAIGQYVACELTKHVPVCLHTRTQCIKSISLLDLNNKQHTIRLQEDDKQDIDCLIICTKSFDASQAFRQYQPRLKKNSTVICLFNGLGPQFDIAARHPVNLWIATTTHGVQKLDHNTIKHTGLGQTLIGQPPSTTNNQTGVIQCFTQFSWQPTTNIVKQLYLKLAINSLINPLTVIYNCQNGALLKNKHALDYMHNLSQEIAKICEYEGIPLTAQYIFNATCEVASQTSNNYSSMQQDAINKRKTEIQTINGYWLTLGKRHSLTTAINEQVIEQTHAITKQS